MHSYFEIISELKSLCSAHLSGTMFIKTQDNKSVRFTLENGEIVNCCFRQTKGYDALPMVLGIESGTFSFNEHAPLGMSLPALPDTDELLVMLASKKVTASTSSGAQQETGPAIIKRNDNLNSKNDVIFAEMKNVLTEYVGPMAGVLFSEYANEKDQIMSDLVEFEHMIDSLASQIGNPAESEEFKLRILDLVSSKL